MERKGKAANEEPGPLTEAYFDEEGRLFIANEELARAIQFHLTTHNGRMLHMTRDRFPEEPAYEEPPRRAMMRSKKSDSTAGPDTTEGDDTGPKVNMMCPCAPEP